MVAPITTYKKVICVHIASEIEGKALPIDDDVALESCCTIVMADCEISSGAHLFDYELIHWAPHLW